MPDQTPDPARDWTHDLRVHLVGLRLDPAREAEIVEELSQHLDDRYEELRTGGASHDEARRLVLDELSESGTLTRLMRRLAQAQTPAPVAPGTPSGGLLSGLWQDLRYALRMLRQHPGVTATIVLTLGIGMAVNATVFTIVNAAVLRPFPFEEADRVVQIGMAMLPGDVGTLSYPDLEEWQAATTTLEQVGASRQTGMTIADDDRSAARLAGAYVSWSMFPLLGVRPVIGRGFVEADDRAGAAPVAILSDETWRTRYGADPGVIGRTVRISGVPATVIGVMPPGFEYPDREKLWLPLAALPEASRTSRLLTLTTFGRLRQGISIDQARAEFTGFIAARAERFPGANTNGRAGIEVPRFGGELMVTLGLLLGAVGFVLLIACANVANLLLARAADRTRDVTLRLALGASRWRIVRQLLVESLVLAAAGGLCGFVLGYAGVKLFFDLPPDMAAPYWVRFTMDRVVFGYVALLSVGSAIVCGLVPAWHAARTNLTAALHDAGRTSAGSRTRRRWTGAFVVAQVTLALVLLTGAAIMIQSVMRLVRHDVGIDTRGLMTATIDLQPAAGTPDRRLLLLDQLDERLASMPQIAAALASHAPLEGAFVRRVRLDTNAGAPVDTLPRVSLVYVGPRYFDVTGASTPPGLPPLADALLDSDAVVVNERFAAMFFPDEKVIGRRFWVTPGERWLTIAGVATDIRQRHLRYLLEAAPGLGLGAGLDSGAVIYRPYTALAENPSEMENRLDMGAFMTILARSTSGPDAVASLVVDRVRTVHPDVPVFGVSTLDDVLMRQLSTQRLIGPLFTIFALIALLLATCGVYAVTAYAVSNRMREIGVRIALGANASRVWWAVTSSTLRQLAIGLVLGGAGAAAVSTVLPASLFGSEGLDPLLLAGIAAVLVAAGLTATAVPARRALRVDPMTTLRAE